MKTVKEDSRIIVILLVCSVLSLFSLTLQSNHACAQDDSPERRGANQKGSWNKQTPHDFYRVIVENNLFRPLGWREPRREPEYVLIATWIESRGETTKALLMERSSNQTYYATTGEKVGNATIENIESKLVELNISGKILTLKIPSIRFLDLRQSLNEPSQLLHGHPNQSAADTTSPQSRQTRVNRVQRDHKQGSDSNRQRWSQRLRDEFRNATLEDRRRFIEEFRQR